MASGVLFTLLFTTAKDETAVKVGLFEKSYVPPWKGWSLTYTVALELLSVLTANSTLMTRVWNASENLARIRALLGGATNKGLFASVNFKQPRMWFSFIEAYV